MALQTRMKPLPHFLCVRFKNKKTSSDVEARETTTTNVVSGGPAGHDLESPPVDGRGCFNKCLGFSLVTMDSDIRMEVWWEGCDPVVVLCSYWPELVFCSARTSRVR